MNTQYARPMRWFACGVAMVLGAAILTGCSPDPDQGPHRACGILDASFVKAATGTAKFWNSWSTDEMDSSQGSGSLLAVGIDDDGSPRKGFNCAVTDSTHHLYLGIDGRNTVNDQDRNTMLATFERSATDPGCKKRQKNPYGVICTTGAETTASLMFPDRWIRITAKAKRVTVRSADATISPASVLKIAENINKNIAARDAAK